MIAGPIETLRASKELASTTTRCPSWCDSEHELTGDDAGFEHHRAVNLPTACASVEAHLRATEHVDRPGEIGPVKLVVFTCDQNAAGGDWLIELPVDVHRLEDLGEAVQRALALLGRAQPSVLEYASAS